MIKAINKTPEQEKRMMEIYKDKKYLFESPISFLVGGCAGTHNGKNFAYIQNRDYEIIK